MNDTQKMSKLNAVQPDEWTKAPKEEQYTLEVGDLTLTVARARLNYGYEWSLLNQGQVVLQSQWCESAQKAKEQAVAFAQRWMVDTISI